ncbi:MFS transporter [Microlunatus sp. Y2014]|uniref:MFS transporter n=1 Tax=Microlunatus sp. Y2014 TaxID=3418488 RepID=UPI003DA778ED
MVPGITSRFGKRNGYIGAAVLAILSFVLIFFVPNGSLPIGIVAWLLFGLGTGGTNALMFSMQADTVDFREWKTGVRAEGGSYSVLSFIRETGQGVGGWLGAGVIGAFGYVVQADVQDPTAQQGIRLAAGLIPAGLAVAATLVMFWYDLDSGTHRRVIRELNARRSEGAVSSTYGVAAGRVRVAEVGDARDLLLRPPDKGVLPVVTIFEREGAGASTIGPAVARTWA